MRNVNRLFQIIQMLRHHRVVTAEAMAEQLGVSVRTIYRDIDHLSVSGVPIMSERGVGYKMKGGFELPPLTFDEDELKALRLGARMVQAWSDPQLQDAAQRMLRKIDGVLSETQRAILEDVPMYAVDVYLSNEDRDTLRLMRQAVETHQRVHMTYLSAKQESTSRTIRPLGVFYTGGRWLVGAWCELREGFRHFQISKMDDIELVGAFAPNETPTVEQLIEGERTKYSKRSPGTTSHKKKDLV